MKKFKLNNALAIAFIALFLGISTIPGISLADHIKFTPNSMKVIQEFSQPTIEESGEYVKIIVAEADCYSSYEQEPMIPFVLKTFEFPLGTKLTNLEIITSDIYTMAIEKKIQPAPPVLRMDRQLRTTSNSLHENAYSHIEKIPEDWIVYNTGAGLDKNNNHVLILSLHIYPIQYIPLENVIQYVNQITVHITYETPEKQPTTADSYDLVIVTPSEYSNKLAPLVEHKNSHGMNTNVVELDEIYGSYPGRDEAEQIKYFIKYAIEEWNAKYLLLVGSINKLPIRTTYPGAIFQIGDVLSDLYYGDIYDDQYEFCDWDANENNKFGECYFNGYVFVNIDEADVYPDINVGRLACKNQREVSTVVKKIINYETKTSGEEWFNRLILCGGDTHPGWNGNEGEDNNDEVAQIMDDFGFEAIRLRASEGTLNWKNINKETNKGAGFLYYSGHGFEIGLGTHPPNSAEWINYRSPHLLGLHNRNKLPIVFFDACLTARLDFNVSELLKYLLATPPNIPRIIGSKLFNSFAWQWVKHPLGGAVATLGATRVAYGGSGYFPFGINALAIRFFDSYEEGLKVSEMHTQAINDYINVIWFDLCTAEEVVLLGDPSLQIGGYG